MSKRLKRHQIATAIINSNRGRVNRHEGYVETILAIGDLTNFNTHNVGEELEAEAWRDGIKLTAVLIDTPVTMTTQFHPHPVRNLTEDEPECNCACDRIDDRTIWRNAAAEAALL